MSHQLWNKMICSFSSSSGPPFPFPLTLPLMAANSINTLKEKKSISLIALTIFVFSFFFILSTRNSSPLSSFQDLQSIHNPTPSPNIEPKIAKIFEADRIPNSSPTQADQPQTELPPPNPTLTNKGEDEVVAMVNIEWKLCKSEDYIPCLDNTKAIKELKSRRHMEHRERHCPPEGEKCLVPLPKGYRVPVPWPRSRDMIWYANAPHPKLVEYKKEQNWIRKSGDYFIFPGGGTQFKGGVNNYIQFIEKTLPSIEWGRHTRVILDVGCGVASFGGYLLDKDVLTMSFAPKDEHEAQIQFALERGIPAFLSVIGTQKLTFPDNVFDVIHCARCRVHWDADGGKPLMELSRILRPGGYFIWSATPVYRDDPRDKGVWKSMVTLTDAICWKTVTTSTDANGIGLVIYQKPISNACYENRKENDPPLCSQSDRLTNSWYSPLDDCLPKLPSTSAGRSWPISWPERLSMGPASLSQESNRKEVEESIYNDTKYWDTLISDVYLHNIAVNWSSVRNVIDLNAGLGGFAAALIKQPLWVMNTVPIHVPDTLKLIFDRGLMGIYHDWCESFNTYPRTYDLIHSNFLFETIAQRCNIILVLAEMDRILRPNGWVVIQDTEDMLKKIIPILKSFHWETNVYNRKFLVAKKSFWRPG